MGLPFFHRAPTFHVRDISIVARKSVLVGCSVSILDHVDRTKLLVFSPGFTHDHRVARDCKCLANTYSRVTYGYRIGGRSSAVELWLSKPEVVGPNPTARSKQEMHMGFISRLKEYVTSLFEKRESSDEPDCVITVVSEEDTLVRCCLCGDEIELRNASIAMVFEYGEEYWCHGCTSKMSPAQLKNVTDRFDTPLHEPGKDDKTDERAPEKL